MTVAAYLRACDGWLCLTRRYVLVAEVHAPRLRAYDDRLCRLRRHILAAERIAKQWGAAS